MMCDNYDSSDSDYVVENYVCPDKITLLASNSVEGDILGNFDDTKRNENGDLIDIKEEKQQQQHQYFMDDSNDNSEYDELSSNEDSDKNLMNDNDDDEDSNHNDMEVIELTTENGKQKINNSQMKILKSNPFKNEPIKDKFTKDQIQDLLRGAKGKTLNRYVLYVTNLNFNTTKDDLQQLFIKAGEIKSIRIPKSKIRKNYFAFIEMCTIGGFQKALQFHNTELNGWPIKIQVSEGGKKKSANKKNIMKQKNRKLCKMRNETKSFTKSGKNYDKNIKKEKKLEKQKNKNYK